jgi:hypothetical protein
VTCLQRFDDVLAVNLELFGDLADCGAARQLRLQFDESAFDGKG